MAGITEQLKNFSAKACEFYDTYEWFVIGIGVVLVLCVLLWILRSYRKAHRGIIPFKTQGGTIEIAPQTLRGVMQNAVNSVEGVNKAACRHFVRGRMIGVRVAIHLQANHRLKEVETQIKKRIRGTLLDQFGMENVDPIHIRITRIVGDPVTPSSVREDEETVDDTDIFEKPDDQDERSYSEDTRL